MMGYTYGNNAVEKCNSDGRDYPIRHAAQSDRFTVTELCEQFGISRKTGYKHPERYAGDGRDSGTKRSPSSRLFAA